MKPFLTLILVGFFFAACHPSGTIDNPSQLTETSIYNIDSVRAVMDAGNEKAARKQLLAAIDIYKNVRDAGKSIAIFKRSIRLKPTALAYFELGSALLDAGSDEEAVNALKIAERLDYSPRASVMFELAEAYNHQKDGNDSISLHYMEVAIQMGYAHPEYFLNNNLFKPMFRHGSYHTVYNNALSGSGGIKGPEAALWKSFNDEFPAIGLPLVINREWIKQNKLSNYISYDYEKFIPEMRTAKFAREAGVEYYYVGLIKKEKTYTALLYGAQEGQEEEDVQPDPPAFILVTYDPDGKIIDKLQVAGQMALKDPFKVFSIQKNGTFEVKDFKTPYKEDNEAKGPDSGSAPVATGPEALVATANYRIGNNGKFEKTDAPLAMR